MPGPMSAVDGDAESIQAFSHAAQSDQPQSIPVNLLPFCNFVFSISLSSKREEIRK